MITSKRKDYFTGSLLSKRKVGPHFHSALVDQNLKCTLARQNKSFQNKNWLYAVEITPWNLRQVLWINCDWSTFFYFTYNSIRNLNPENFVNRNIHNRSWLCHDAHCNMTTILQVIIFSETTAKYEKREKYLSILHEAPYDNYFIISTQKFAMNAI